MKTLRQILTQYKSEKRALPAFNIDTFEIFQAVENAVIETGLPCLVQLSPGEDSFIQAERLYLLARKARINGLPIYLNMDHGNNTPRLSDLVGLGFDMVHFDGSSLEYSVNIKTSQEFVTQIRSVNPDIVVEVEFNKINLVENGISPDSLTNPTQALEFVNTTRADLLAVSIGNLHGVNTTNPEKINLDLLRLISQSLSNTFLTLHGGSGIGIDQVLSAINLGIVKININTDLRLKFKRSLGLSLANLDTEKLYRYFEPVISDVAQVAKQKLIQFHNDT